MTTMKVAFYIRPMGAPDVDHYHRSNNWKQIVFDTDEGSAPAVSREVAELIEQEVARLLAAGRTAADIVPACSPNQGGQVMRDFGDVILEMNRKYGDPRGSPYAQGRNDQGICLHGEWREYDQRRELLLVAAAELLAFWTAGWEGYDDEALARVATPSALLKILKTRELLRMVDRKDAGSPSEDGDALITYKNYRGEVAPRLIRPIHWLYGRNEWHPKAGWLCYAWDTNKKAFRYFAQSSILLWADMPRTEGVVVGAPSDPA